MDPPVEALRTTSLAALMRAARSTYAEAVHGPLAESGFEDIPRDGVFAPPQSGRARRASCCSDCRRRLRGAQASDAAGADRAAYGRLIALRKDSNQMFSFALLIVAEWVLFALSWILAASWSSAVDKRLGLQREVPYRVGLA
jgi:hypothetical protein